MLCVEQFNGKIPIPGVMLCRKTKTEREKKITQTHAIALICENKWEIHVSNSAIEMRCNEIFLIHWNVTDEKCITLQCALVICQWPRSANA